MAIDHAKVHTTGQGSRPISSMDNCCLPANASSKLKITTGWSLDELCSQTCILAKPANAAIMAGLIYNLVRQWRLRHWVSSWMQTALKSLNRSNGEPTQTPGPEAGARGCLEPARPTKSLSFLPSSPREHEQQPGLLHHPRQKHSSCKAVRINRSCGTDFRPSRCDLAQSDANQVEDSLGATIGTIGSPRVVPVVAAIPASLH